MASHHYVPQFLLRRWADTKGRLESFRFIPQAGRTALSPGHTKSACQQEDLYALQHAAPTETQNIERGFFAREIDNPAANALERLERVGVRGLKLNEKSALATLMLSLPARRPEIVSAVKAVFPKLLNADPVLYQKLRQPGDPETLSEFAEMNGLYEDPIHAIVKTIRDNCEQHIPDLVSMCWWTRELHGQDLVISDAPLLTKPEHRFRNGMNLFSSYTLIALPLGPSTVLFVSRDPRHRHELRCMSASRIAALLNSQSVRRAEERVFARTGTRLQKQIEKWFSERHRSQATLLAGQQEP